MVRDSVTLIGLIVVTAILFAITLFLFRSFMAHRQELAQRWSERGRAAIDSGHPEQAIVAFRTALSYAPDERSYELMLAQALGDAGHTDESYTYFQGLWETAPGDGLINLRLARLADKKADTQGAIHYYRASIYGTWEGDGTVRRREVRMELARYLIAHHDVNAARAEMVIAEGNNPNDAGFALTLAEMMRQADVPKDALSYYERALVLEPGNVAALEGAGRLRYEEGDFEESYRLLEQAARERSAKGGSGAPGFAAPDIDAMRKNAERILALAPSKKLSEGERVTRILALRDLAKRRFEGCSAKAAADDGVSSPLLGLGGRWARKEAMAGRRALLKNAEEQDALVKLIADTEVQTSAACGAPSGDDALVLLLANASKKMGL